MDTQGSQARILQPAGVPPAGLGRFPSAVVPTAGQDTPVTKAGDVFADIVGTPNKSSLPSIPNIADLKYGPQSQAVRSVAVALFNGMTTAEIAEEYAMSHEEVVTVSQTQACQARLRTLLLKSDATRLRGILKAASVDAVMTMRRLIQSENPSVALTAAKYVIDRSLGVQTLSKRGLEAHEVEDPEEALKQVQQQKDELQRQLAGKKLL